MLIGFPRGCKDPRLRYAACPTCGTRGNFRRHGSYSRWKAAASRSGRLPDERVELDRVFCRTCHSTHTLMPHDIVPRSLYPRPFRAFVALTRLDNSQPTIRQICSSFGISARTYYLLTSSRKDPPEASIKR